MEARDPVANGKLDALIREGRITAEMATSVINDTGYVRAVCDKLTDLAQLVEGHRAEEQAMAQAG